jgi:hypothetical protein
VPQLIGIALVPRRNATALSSSRTYGNTGEESTDIQSTCPPPNARLAETSIVSAGHGHEHQGASPAAPPGRTFNRDTTTESILVSSALRSEPASRRPSVPADPALTRFPPDGRDTKRRRHQSQTIRANAMKSTERVVIRKAAATVMIAFVVPYDYANWRLPDSGKRCRRELGCDQMMHLFSLAMLLTLMGYFLFRTSKL